MFQIASDTGLFGRVGLQDALSHRHTAVALGSVRKDAAACAGQNRRAYTGQIRHLRDPDRHPGDICHKLTPKGAFGGPAGQLNTLRTGANRELLHHPNGLEGHALHDGPGQIILVVGKGHTQEGGFWKSLSIAGQSRSGIEEQAVPGGVPMGHHMVDVIIGKLGAVFLGSQVLPPPFQTYATGGKLAHGAPFAPCGRDGLTQTQRKIRMVCNTGDDPAGAGADQQIAVLDGTGPQGHGVLVMGTGHQNRIGGQTQLPGSLCRQLADDAAGWHRTTQLVRPDPGKAEDILIVSTLPEIIKLIDACIRQIQGGNAGRFGGNVIRHRQKHGGLFKNIRLIVPHPADLQGGKSVLHTPAGFFIHGSLSECIAEGFPLGFAAGIAPNRSRRQRAKRPIHRHHGAALGRNGDGCHIFCHGRFAAKLLHGLADSLPPILRILLAETQTGCGGGVAPVGLSHQAPVLPEQQGFGAGGADINTQYILHKGIFPFCGDTRKKRDTVKITVFAGK